MNVDVAHMHVSQRACDESASLVAKVLDLLRRTEQEKEFAAWLEAMRAKHKTKRNFIPRLNKSCQSSVELRSDFPEKNTDIENSGRKRNELPE